MKNSSKICLNYRCVVVQITDTLLQVSQIQFLTFQKVFQVLFPFCDVYSDPNSSNRFLAIIALSEVSMNFQKQVSNFI